MKFYQTLIIFIALLTITTTNSQDKKKGFGLKAGWNYGKYTPDKNSIEYKYKQGFYIGGFFDFKLEEKLNFQPEMLFALQGSQINAKDNYITDGNGNPMPYTDTFDFEYKINELTVLIPLMIQVYVSQTLYIESGPQVGFILDRKISSSQELLDGNDNSFIVQDGDSFDFGVNVGVGYDVSKKISLNVRAYSGLIKRDDEIKLLTFNLGIGYDL